MRGQIYILTGPSGVGKTTVAQELLTRRDNLTKIITCTTRPIREGEVDGVAYHFLREDVFKKLIDQEAFFEWDQHYDYLYGSRKSDVEAVLASGKNLLFVVDVRGAKTIKSQHPEAMVLFLQPNTPEELLARLQKRDKGDTAGFEKRKQAMNEELQFGKTAEYQIVNKEGKLQSAIKKTMKILDDLDGKA